jgi:hypothetical protein
MTWWFVRSPTLIRKPGNLAYLLDAPHPILKKRKRLQRGRELQRVTFRYKHGLRQECICIFLDDVEYRLRLRKAGPLMNVESQNKRMILRLKSSVRWCVSLALLSATVLPAPSFSQGTPEQRVACTSHVLRLCSAFIPNTDEITTCLRERSAELSDACRTAIQAEVTQLPSTSDSNGTRKRTAR